MLRYVGRKLLLTVPLLLGVVTLTFVLVELAPGSVADKFFTPDTTPEVRQIIVEKYGLDRPAIVRYGLMMRNLLLLDFGVSMVQERPVFRVIGDALPNTLVLSFVSLLVMYPAGILLGTLQGVRHGTAVDAGISVGTLFFYSMPAFWLAMMLQLLFAYWWPLLPASGMYDAVMFDFMAPDERLANRARHLVLPGLAMGFASAASVARYMRSSLLEVIQQDFVRTARAKGLKERTVVLKHAVRNALLPIVTLFGLTLPYLFSGAVLIEVIFAWPGMGRLIIDAIYTQDTPVLIACFFVFALVVQVGNLLADVLYAVVDPRIRYD